MGAPAAARLRSCFLLPMLVSLSSSTAELFLSSTYAAPWCVEDGGFGCVEGTFCNSNDNKTKVFCQTCPDPGSIDDDCGTVGFSTRSIEECHRVCGFAQIGEPCSKNSSCFPGLAFCDNDGEAGSGMCRPCKTNLTECLEFTSDDTQQRCLSCEFECDFKVNVQVVVNSSSSSSATAVGAEDLGGGDSAGSGGGEEDEAMLVGTTVNVSNQVVFGAPQSPFVAGRLNDCVIDPNNGVDRVCLNVNSTFCLLDIVPFDARGGLQDNAVLACERGGGVGALLYDSSSQENITELPNIWITYESTKIPATAISYESATILQSIVNDQGALGTVSASITARHCNRVQRCSDDVPCVGMHLRDERTSFCGSDGRCSACPVESEESGEIDSFRCFFAEDGWQLYDQKDIQSCARDCGSRLSFGSCKFCPKEVTGLEFGVADESEQCKFCASWEDVQYPDRAMRLFRSDVLCWEVQSFFETVQVPADSQNCRLAQMMSYICGCSNGPGYGGANTNAKKVVLAWLPRAMAILSFLGSSFIIVDVLRLRSRRRLVFNQLMASLSCFDLIGATAYAFTSLPVQSTDYIYGSAGNDATCIAQGFFIQVGTISCYKNVSLAVYYYLVIVNGWSEHRVHKIRLWLFSIPVLMGLAFACAGIPFYDNMILWCNNAAPFWPDIPVAVAILCATVIMAVVCAHVHMQEKVSARWRDPVSTVTSQRSGGVSSSVRCAPRNRLSSKVMWQAFWYLMAFYITWPPYLALQYSWASGKALTNYGLILAAGTMAPLQGFWNFLVYMRPRYLSRRSNSSRRTTHFSTGISHSSGMMRQALSGVRSAFFSSEKVSGSKAGSFWKHSSDSCAARLGSSEKKESAREIASVKSLSEQSNSLLTAEQANSSTAAAAVVNNAALPPPSTESPTAAMVMSITTGQPAIIHGVPSFVSSELGSRIPVGETVAQSFVKTPGQSSGRATSAASQTEEVVEDVNLDQIMHHLAPSASTQHCLVEL